MKTYHPIEDMAALLTVEMGNTDKVGEYIEECKRLMLPDGSRGIKVLPPDVNISDKDFTPIYVDPADDSLSDGAKHRGSKKTKRKPTGKQGVIRFGLMAVRGVGE